MLSALLPGRLQGRLSPWIWTSIAAFGLAIYANKAAWGQESKPAGDEKGASAIKGLEGLGFSIAPKGGGKTRTGLFGVYGDGYKFVYVLDRSGSMGGSGRTSLKAVKEELVASLRNLDTVHQFQIIFYNEKPVLFNPTGTPGRLIFGTDQNKELVARFLDTIEAEGGTDHEEALRLACTLRPDVVFFLTDGDEPQLTAEQLDRIDRWAGGTRINTIQFGPGPKPQKESFLQKLASQSGGDYVYVDTSRWKK